MLKIQKHSDKRPAVSFLICLGICILCAVCFSLIFAEIANLSHDPTGMVGIFSLVALLISAAASGLVTAKLNREAGLGFMALTAASGVVIMMVICLIASGGRISAGAFMNYGCYFGIFMLFSLLAKRKGAKRRKRHR